MIGGIYFAGAPFAGVLRSGTTAAALAAAATISVTTAAALDAPPQYLAGTAAITWTSDGALDNPPSYLAGDATIVWTTAGTMDRPPAVNMGAGIWIGGVNVTGRVRVDGLTVHDILNDAPNTATFTIEGDAPAVGQLVRIYTGDVLLFTGAVQTIDQAYESLPKYLAWHITAIDDTAEANARRPFGTFLNVSATTIAQYITGTFAPAFAAGIEAGLPNLTIVFDGSETFITCLSRLATAVGGYCKIEDHAVYLFTEDLTAPPDPIDDAHRFLASPPISVNTDSSQLRTRVYGKGYGENILSDVASGETLLPIPDGALFPPLGGSLIAAVTPDGAQSEKLTFAGVVPKSGGSLVGTGASPTAAPLVALLSGVGVTSGEHTLSVAFRTASGQSRTGPPATITTGIQAPPDTAPTANPPTAGTGPDPGAHTYAVSFVTASGETVAGAISNAVTTSAAVLAQLPPPAFSPAAGSASGSGIEVGAHSYVVTFTDANGETPASTPPGPPGSCTATQGQLYVNEIALGPPGTTGRKLYREFNGAGGHKFVATIANNTDTDYLDALPNASRGALAPTANTTGTLLQRIPVTDIPRGPSNVTARKLYRRFNGTGTFKLAATIANNSSTTHTDSVRNSALGANALTTGTATGNQIAVTLPIGPVTVTARELYMSPAGAGQLRHLIQTIANNTTTDVTVTLADAAIIGGALEPTEDSSGLKQPDGQVNPGSTVLPVASSSPFRLAGGWVILGGGQVVKHSGISGNTLTGIPAAGPGAITTTVLYGQQAIPSAMLVGVTGVATVFLKGSAVHIWVQRDDLLAQSEHAARTGGSGIVEFLIVDTRRGVDSLVARCDADLALFARPIVTVGYATRDLKTKSGKPIVINLPSQRLSTTLTIQDVTITEIDIAKGLAPRFTVKASSVRFSLEDTLRRLVAVGPVTVNT